ncbi:MAG TPA: SPOR domain-containing protein [Tabrizicola sp.]|nr:SPOR domain-containing protein [Tabrizicola sp.]
MIRAAVLLVLAALPAMAEPLQPAELPPPDYAGLQYVDSKGCLFARAGTGTAVNWVPRVSREGVPTCGHPPSGKRVPVVEEVGVQPVTASSPTATDEAEEGYLVAVGSFSQQDHVTQAEARLVELDYASIRGRVNGGSGTLTTVFAGPFPDEAAARVAVSALRESGFPDAMLVLP